jgi:hypothetical protein
MRFVVTFRPAPGTDGIRALRLLLKSAKRQFGLIAVDAREITDTDEAPNTARPDVNQQFLGFVRSITR